MKKTTQILTSVVMAGALASTINAKDLNEKIVYQNGSQWYVGLSKSNTSGTREVKYENDSSASASTSQSSTSIKIGKVLANSDRWEFLSTSMKNKIDGSNNTQSAFEINGITSLESLRYKRFLPYIVANLGYWTNKTYYENTTGKDMNGFGFGMGIGGIYQFNNNIEFDIGYNQKVIHWFTDENSYTTELSDTAKGITFAMNYKF